jgi:hypothetical protein
MRHHERMDAGRLSPLIADLDEAIDLLQAAGETHWLKWLRNSRDQIALGDPHGLDHLLGAFGGMGSFNDLVLRQPNAAGTPDELQRADDRLWDLRESIWRKSSELRHRLAE